jgi:dihydropyrimidinase
MCHCENIEIIYKFKDLLRKQGRSDISAWSEARPAWCEAESIRSVLFIASSIDSPIYIPHVSSEAGLNAVKDFKGEYRNIYAETCPHYITLTNDYRRGPLGKVNPPLLKKEDIDALWMGIATGLIDTVGSDHCFRTKDQKKELWTAKPGFSGTALVLPIMLSEGVNRGRIGLEHLVRVCCLNPAKIFGMYPQKGSLVVGSDADVTIVDLNKKVRITDRTENYELSDFSLWEGWELKGWPVATVVRGNLVMRDGEIVGKPGVGKYVPRYPVAKAPKIASVAA